MTSARKLAAAALAASAALFLVPTPSAAQPTGPGFHLELTPTVGWRTGGELERSVSDIFDEDVQIEDSETFGLIANIPVAPYFFFELLIDHQDSNFRSDSGLFEGDEDVGDVTVDNYQVGLVWQWGAGQVYPFFTATLGIANINPEVEGASSESRFAGTFGGGVKVFFSRNVGMRFEGRGYWADLGGDDEDYCGYYGCYSYDNDLYQFGGSVGLIIAF